MGLPAPGGVGGGACARVARRRAHSCVRRRRAVGSRDGCAGHALSNYVDFNLVRVEGEPEMSVDALMAFADDALGGLSHRHVDFDLVEAGERRRAEFEAHGWQVLRLLWMRLEQAGLRESRAVAEEVAYDAVEHMRTAWLLEDDPDFDRPAFRAGPRGGAAARSAGDSDPRGRRCGGVCAGRV
jgi:hypothetical protein